MMNMRPPQQGQGRASAGGSVVLSAAASGVGASHTHRPLVQQPPARAGSFRGPIVRSAADFRSLGATHFLTKTLPKVATEMALCVLAYNLTRVMNIVGIKPLIAAIAA